MFMLAVSVDTSVIFQFFLLQFTEGSNIIRNGNPNLAS